MSPRRECRRGCAPGFTRVEWLVAGSVTAILLGALLAVALMLGHNLLQILNPQSPEASSHRVVRQFTQDLSAATRLTTCTAAQVAMTLPGADGANSVTYQYSPGAGTLVRTDAAGSSTLLTQLSALAISYYDHTGAKVSGQPSRVYAVELSFSAAGSQATAGTQVSFTTVTPRVVLRAKLPRE